MRGLKGRWVVLLAALATLGGCKSTTLNKGRCDKASDCSGGLTCDNLSTCVPTTLNSAPCSNNAQCGSDYACDNLQWCVCQVPNSNLSASADPCSNGTLPPYRGDMTDGGAPDAKSDASDGGPACSVSNCTSPKTCSDAGACVECAADSQCNGTVTKPICDPATNTCVPCTTDAQCIAKLGTANNPGVCMFHTDGHCATDSETVYVKVAVNLAMCPAVNTQGAGSSSNPFCQISDALALGRVLIVLRGASIPGGTAIQNSAPLSLVGQNAIVNAGPGQSGIHVSGTDVYIRDLKLQGTDATATLGIVADGSSTLRLDGLDIENMPQGGLRVTDGASYNIVNSIFAGNGGVLDDAGRSIGGAFLLNPPTGQSSRFAFNTVVANQAAGVLCTSLSQTLDASLLAHNLGSGALPDYGGCTLSATSKALGTSDPMLTTTYREAGPTSPCVDFVATPPVDPPDHDIDLIGRPQGNAFDCGASEYKAP